MSHRLFAATGAFVLLTLGLVPDRPDGGRAVAAPLSDGRAVVFTAHDYGFAGPDRIPAGVTTMQVVNQGHEPHHIQLLQLLEGKSADDFRTALAADPERLPRWIRFVGGPNAVLPGGESAATMNLGEGDYLLICLIPNREGKAHMALGMQKTLSVGGGKPTLVSAPKADMTITLADYRFTRSHPITAGTHTIRVMNHGSQPHEVVVVKLDRGASAKDFGVAAESGTAGPPPGRPVGGVVGIESGGLAYFTARFEPGRYGLICFFHDPVTGKPHFEHGMTSEFTVK